MQSTPQSAGQKAGAKRNQATATPSPEVPEHLDKVADVQIKSAVKVLQEGRPGVVFVIATGTDLFGKYEELKEPAYGSFVRALNGLCGGSPNWRLQDIPGSDLLLKMKSALQPPGDPPPPGHVLRATENGRAVWFPKYFAEHFQGQERDRPVLGSYHRRLTLSSLQVESLITFLQRNQGFFKSGKMNADLDARMRWACQILGKLYGGRGTYRSYSANEQIDTRAKFINSIRKGFKMKELHRV